MNLCYTLLDHLQKMRQCSYVAETVRQGKFASITKIKYMCTKDGKQIHELDDALQQN